MSSGIKKSLKALRNAHFGRGVALSHLFRGISGLKSERSKSRNIAVSGGRFS